MGRLNEWKDDQGNKVSAFSVSQTTASNTTSKSNKEKFTDLLYYMKKHKDYFTTDAKVTKLDNTGFEYSEHREIPATEIKYDLKIDVSCSRFKDLFAIHIFKNGKQIETFSADKWEDLLRFIKIYFNAPTQGSQEYKDLCESVSIADDFKLYENLWD